MTKILAGVAIGLGILLIAFPFAIIGGLPVMLALGICHSQWSQVPAFGFWATVVLLWALRVVVQYPISRASTTES